ncbi:MAG: hypothetical protein LKM31_03750 [Sphingobium sp.]|jgi:polyphosphate kinase|nr:hypothetical protein [Sphingobium sp.]
MRCARRLPLIRDSDIEIEEEAEDLVRYFEERDQAAPARARSSARDRGAMPDAVAAFIQALTPPQEDVIVSSRGCWASANSPAIVEEDRPELKFEPSRRASRAHPRHGGDCFAAIREKDIVVHHPYESFDVVVAFLRQAARTRCGGDQADALPRRASNPVIAALIEAAEAGKSVTAVVELKARFDEEQNLLWARQLERAGVQVVYGFIDWKTHAKVSMVVRREGDGYRTYCHFGTGNYHPVTARIYTDLSFFTADPRRWGAMRAAVQLHHRLCRAVAPGTAVHLADHLRDQAAPDRCRDRQRPRRASRRHLGQDELADRPGDHRRGSMPPACRGADRSGVRGICCLRPGVRAVGEHPGQVDRRPLPRAQPHRASSPTAGSCPHDARVFISSADWMPRNLDRRVE